MDFLNGKIKTIYFKYLAAAFGSALIVLKITDPPIPIRSPMLYMIFHTGATTARAADPSGP